MLLCHLSCRRGNDASNHVTWDFDASTMVRPTKSTEDGADSNSASSAGVASTTTMTAVSNQRSNDQDSLTPTESNHKVPFSEEGEGQGEELPISPQLGIDETAMVLESGNRKSIVEGAEKRNSVVLVGEDGVDGHNSIGHNAVGHEKVSVCVPSGWMLQWTAEPLQSLLALSLSLSLSLSWRVNH